MEVMFLLIGVSLTLALVFLGAFIWAVHSGQYSDCYTPSMKILFDESEEEDHTETQEFEGVKNP